MKLQITLSALALAMFLSLGGIAASQATGHDTPEGNDPTHSNQPMSDSWITTKVKAGLASTHGVKSTDVSVTTTDGTVTLTGVLANDLAVRKAVATAQSVQGVKKVDASGLKSQD